MVRFDLIAMDLDGTLLDWRGREAVITGRCKEALFRAVGKGVCLVIATGRGLRETLLELFVQGVGKDMPFPDFLIAQEKFCYQIVDGKAEEKGALTVWNREREKEARWVMEAFVLPHLPGWLKALREEGLSPNRWVVDTGAGWFSLIYDDEGKTQRAEKLLRRLGANIPDLITNRNATVVGFIPRNGTKGKALKFLTENLGIRPERVMAIGDGINDLDMLNGEHGFFPVAVANGEVQIKEAVLKAKGFVTKSAASDGVAEAIEWALQG